jgi:hypothetical protein
MVLFFALQFVRTSSIDHPDPTDDDSSTKDRGAHTRPPPNPRLPRRKREREKLRRAAMRDEAERMASATARSSVVRLVDTKVDS